jgi:hypothetical protein
MFLHFELGIAVVIADLLDVEEFMDAVGFDDHDKDPRLPDPWPVAWGSVPEFSDSTEFGGKSLIY